MGFKDSDEEEDRSEGHVDRGTQDSFGQEDGEDLQACRGSICCRVLDHYVEGFKGSTTISYRDQELVGSSINRFFVCSTRETT
jgi:hypothetical protein